jgi:hypothetical protein
MKASFLLALSLAVGPAQLQDEGVNRADYAPCGLNSFFLGCRLLEPPVRWEEAKELLGPLGTYGIHSFADIARAGEAAGLYPVGLMTNLDRLGDLPMPAIILVREPRRANNSLHLLVSCAGTRAAWSCSIRPCPLTRFLPKSSRRFGRGTSWSLLAKSRMPSAFVIRANAKVEAAPRGDD